MFSHSLLFAGLLLGAPPEPAGPRLEKGLEVRWTGTFTEASFRPGVRGIRTYDVDTRLFVLDTGDYGADAILFTRVFLKPDRKSDQSTAGVVRLDMVQINPKGRVQLMPSPADPDNPDAKLRPWPPVQLQGLPVREAGMFFEFPDKLVEAGLRWSRQEVDRPDISWKVADLQTFRGYPALKLVAEQKTSGYYSERIRKLEWHRKDTLTVEPKKGFAARLERIIEKRDTEEEELSFRSVLTLEQQGRIVYSGRLYEERRDESVNAAAFTAMLDRLLAAGGRNGLKPFEALARRITTYLSDHGAYDTLPYREAVLAVRKRAESAAKGNLPPAPVPDTTAKPTDPLAIGAVIPDISVTGITSTGSVKLSEFRGKPLLVAYFQPTANSARPILMLADELAARKWGRVLPLAIGDPGDVRKLARDLKTATPVYDATDVFKTHGLSATPVFVIVDADGVVRHVLRGWGGESAATVTREFERWAK